MLVFLQKILCTGEGNLVDVALHFVGRHADPVITNGQGFGFPVHRDIDATFIAFGAVTCHGCHAALADGIGAVADEFPEEDLMAGINGLLDDREDIFRMDLNLTLFEHRHQQA